MSKLPLIFLAVLVAGCCAHESHHGYHDHPHQIEYTYFEIDSSDEEAAYSNEEETAYSDESAYPHAQYRFFQIGSDEEAAYSDEDSYSDEKEYKFFRMGHADNTRGYYGYLYDDHYGEKRY